MKTKIFLIFIAVLFFSGNIFSQNKKEVVYGKITTRDFSDTKVTLKYELPAGDFPNIPYKVTLTVKTESEDFKVLVGLSGDYGDEVRPGDNLSLTWNFTEEGFVKSDVKDSEMSIEGTRILPPVNITPQPVGVNLATKRKVKLPSVVLPSSIIVVGAGIFSFGISQEISAQGDYDFYRDNIKVGFDDNPNYTEAVRDQYLKDARDKRKVGFSAMGLGVLATTAGAYLFLKKAEARNEAKKRLSFQPDVRLQNNASTSVGGKIVFNF